MHCIGLGSRNWGLVLALLVGVRLGAVEGNHFVSSVYFFFFFFLLLFSSFLFAYTSSPQFTSQPADDPNIHLEKELGDGLGWVCEAFYPSLFHIIRKRYNISCEDYMKSLSPGLFIYFYFFYFFLYFYKL